MYACAASSAWLSGVDTWHRECLAQRRWKWDRPIPDGDVDVDSRHTLIRRLNSDMVMMEDIVVAGLTSFLSSCWMTLVVMSLKSWVEKVPFRMSSVVTVEA